MARREAALRRGLAARRVGTGSGFGLAIVADIAEACGATLSFEDNADGFAVTLRIPREARSKRLRTAPRNPESAHTVNHSITGLRCAEGSAGNSLATAEPSARCRVQA